MRDSLFHSTRIRFSISTMALSCLCPLFAALGFLLVPRAATAQSSGPRRPNIVFILADDLGWSDTTLYGTTRLYQTPNIERLAQRGIRFTQAYAANPLCSPTRASILSGLYPGRIGMTLPSGGAAEERFTSTLPPQDQPWRKIIEPLSVT